MANSRIIPDFMQKHPKNIFKILLPLNLKIDSSNYANNKFEVLIQDCSEKKLFTYNLSSDVNIIFS